MLCAIRQSDNNKVIAKNEAKQNAPFKCPGCNEFVILRKGLVYTHHFAHHVSKSCEYGRGETEKHRTCKNKIYEELLNNPAVKKAELERWLKTVRPDVSAYINGTPVAMEVQISALSNEVIKRRMEEYNRLGIYVLWLPQWSKKLDDYRYSPSFWERWLHAAYFGRVYYWMDGLSVVPYHFSDYYLDKDEYNNPSEDVYVPRSFYVSKRFKTPIKGNVLNIATDFIPKTIPVFKSKHIKIPPSKIFIDKNYKETSDLWRFQSNKHRHELQDIYFGKQEG